MGRTPRSARVPLDPLFILLEIFGDVLSGLRLFGAAAVPDAQRLDNMLASGFGFLAAGCAAGYWSALLAPHRFCRRRPSAA